MELLLNPRYLQCMLDEDFVRRCKQILTGVHSNLYSLRGLQHYCLAVSLRWTRNL